MSYAYRLNEDVRHQPQGPQGRAATDPPMIYTINVVDEHWTARSALGLVANCLPLKVTAALAHIALSHAPT